MGWGCSNRKKSNAVRHDTYFLGEYGFEEVRYIGWQLPYSIYGERQLYEFDKRQKLVDCRDAEYLLEVYEDGVKIFDKVESDSTQAR